MRIARFLVVLIFASSTLVGCQGTDRGGTTYGMYSAQVFGTSLTNYERQIATFYPDAVGSQLSLLDRIRGRRPNCSPSNGCDFQSPGINSIVASPIINARSSCDQFGNCGCQPNMKTNSAVRSIGSPSRQFTKVTSSDHSSLENSVVPRPPSRKYQLYDDNPMISSKVIDRGGHSSQFESGRPRQFSDPAIGNYEKTSAPDFVTAPQNSTEQTFNLPNRVHNNVVSPDSDRRNQTDFGPAAQPVFPELPSGPGAYLENRPVNAQPASSLQNHSDSDTPRTVLPESLKQLPLTPMPQTPIRDPVNERLAMVPDQVAEISNQISEISKRVAEISDRVLNDVPAGTAAAVDSQPAALAPAVETSGNVSRVDDQPVILKARPKEKFSFTDNRVATKEESSPVANGPQVPIYNVSHHALNQIASRNPANSGAFQQAEATRFSSPTVAKRAQTQLPLRYESDARRAQDQLFDIQALIQKEIDRRIREGQLVPVNKQPAIKPKSSIGVETEQTANLNRISVLQVSQPVTRDSTAQRSTPQSISRPPRRPAAPVLEFEIPTDDETEIGEVDDENCDDSSEAYTPNLFVPVFEIDSFQPKLLEININAAAGDDASFEQGIHTPSRICVDAIPGKSVQPLGENNLNQALPFNSQSGPAGTNSTSASIQAENGSSENEVMLRLRATANPQVPQKSPPIVRIRNVSTQFLYQQPQYRDDEVTPLPSEIYQPPASSLEPGVIEIDTIRALPVEGNEILQREIRGLTERPTKQEASAARILER